MKLKDIKFYFALKRIKIMKRLGIIQTSRKFIRRVQTKSLIRERSNKAGKAEDAKEFHKTEMAEKKEAQKWKSLGFSILPQYSSVTEGPFTL